MAVFSTGLNSCVSCQLLGQIILGTHELEHMCLRRASCAVLNFASAALSAVWCPSTTSFSLASAVLRRSHSELLVTMRPRHCKSKQAPTKAAIALCQAAGQFALVPFSREQHC